MSKLDGADNLQTAPMISVVIPTYNEQHRIRTCLRSIFSQSTEHDFEVIVVDSSKDSTPQIVSEEFPGVFLIHREQQTFAAEARNIGIQNAKGTVIAFIDADCVAEPDWINALVASHEQPYAAVGGPISLNSPTTLAGAVLFGIEFSEYGRASRKREIRWLPSCNLSVKRSVLEQFGGFSTQMQASEDMLFTRRLMERSGQALCFDPAVRIRHSNRNNFAELKSKLETLGHWSGRSRSLRVIPGGFLLRLPFVIPLLLPYRLILIMIRLLFWSRDARLIAIAAIGWPLLAYGLLCWTRAFLRGTMSIRQSPLDLTNNDKDGP